MKKFRKLFALLVAAVLVISMSMTAFAEGEDEGEGGEGTSSYTVTVTNAIAKEEYTIYKVFDATVKEGRTDGGTGISYSSTWMTQSNDYFAVDAAGNITIKDAGKKDDGTLSDGAITWLKSQISKFVKGETITADSATVTFNGLADGYYYISTTTGSFITVDSINPNVEVQEKNSLPTGDKKQNATPSNYSDDLVEVNIGDTVYYQYVITDGKGTDKDITLTDTLSEGLTLQDAITVEDKNGTVAAGNYELTKNTTGFVLTLKGAYVATLDTNDTVTVTYSAILNADAVIDSATGNVNTAKIQYSKQDEIEDKVYTATYDFLLKKTDGTDFVPGAGFRLYDEQKDGNEIKLAKDNTGYYTDKQGSEEILVDSENGVNVRGLKPGTYYLEETTTPDGYNTLTERKAVTISSGATTAVEVTVINEAGAELPTTGGIGTTIFHILGSILVIGAGVLLVTKRRMDA